MDDAFARRQEGTVLVPFFDDYMLVSAFECSNLDWDVTAFLYDSGSGRIEYMASAGIELPEGECLDLQQAVNRAIGFAAPPYSRPDNAPCQNWIALSREGASTDSFEELCENVPDVSLDTIRNAVESAKTPLEEAIGDAMAPDAEAPLSSPDLGRDER